MLPTCERLRELFDYDCDTGVLTRRVPRGGVAAGEEAGTDIGEGYLYIDVDGHTLGVHRVVWCWVFGGWPREQIDHRNGLRAANWLGNLRDVSVQQNQQNRQRANLNSKTGVLGVSPYKGGYRASIRVDGRLRCLGTSKNLDECAAMYAVAKQQHHIGR